MVSEIEHVAFVEIGDARIGLAESGHLPVDVDPEHLACVDGGIGGGKDGALGGVEVVGHVVHRRGGLYAGRGPRKRPCEQLVLPR